MIHLVNGGLSGSIAMCSGCSLMEPWSACAVGVIAGAMYMMADRIILEFFRIDDPVSASAVHMIPGAWGTFATSLFLNPQFLPPFPNGGVFYAWDWNAFVLMGIQVMGVSVVVLWSSVLTVVIMLFFKFLGILRATEKEEEEGAFVVFIFCLKDDLQCDQALIFMMVIPRIRLISR